MIMRHFESSASRSCTPQHATILAPLQHQDGPARRLRCRTLTKYGREAAASIVSFHPIDEISGGPLPLHDSAPPSSSHSSSISPFSRSSDDLFLLKRPATEWRHL
ncbi:hypothetical protein EVAR_40252_1 [Eumeta japonica]|uniref:Uncharacterized protein n=1 Tax=Eumeta variegata TaxID=151549 RepID=A0A4C1Y4L7_EUMVA|nr:hypothetical protein EVAR_40252_1 [Eumeta japonica]